MSKPSLVVALVEDQRQRQLIYRFLRHAGVRRDQIRLVMSPSGRGSAEQWVRNIFVAQTRKCRARQARTGMFAMIDADLKSVDDRLGDLDEALVAAGQKPIDRSRDKIARLIPKRNVETWILALCQSRIGVIVDEISDYKKIKTQDEWTALIPAAAATLSELVGRSATVPENLLDSLKRAIIEIPRALSAGE